MAPILPLPQTQSFVDAFNAGLHTRVSTLAGQGKKVFWVSEMESITTSLIAPDQIHPFTSAYALIADKWLQAIRRATTNVTPSTP